MNLIIAACSDFFYRQIMHMPLNPSTKAIARSLSGRRERFWRDTDVNLNYGPVKVIYDDATYRYGVDVKGNDGRFILVLHIIDDLRSCPRLLSQVRQNLSVRFNRTASDSKRYHRRNAGVRGSITAANWPLLPAGSCAKYCRDAKRLWHVLALFYLLQIQLVALLAIIPYVTSAKAENCSKFVLKKLPL